MLDVPSQANIEKEKPVKMLVAPPGVKGVSRVNPNLFLVKWVARYARTGHGW